MAYAGRYHAFIITSAAFASAALFACTEPISLIGPFLAAVTGAATAFMVIELLALLPWKPDHRVELDAHRVARQGLDVAYAPRASAFAAFIVRARRHAEFLGSGFVPDAHRAAIAA